MKVLIVGCGAVGQVYGLASATGRCNAGIARPARLRGKVVNRPASKVGASLPGHPPPPEGSHPLPLKDYQVSRTRPKAGASRRTNLVHDPLAGVLHRLVPGVSQRGASKRVVCFTPGQPARISDRGRGDGSFWWNHVHGLAGDLGGGGEARRRSIFTVLPLAFHWWAIRTPAVSGQLLKPAGFRASIGKPGSSSQVSVTL